MIGRKGRTVVVLALFVLIACGPGTKEEAPVLLRVADGAG